MSALIITDSELPCAEIIDLQEIRTRLDDEQFLRTHMLRRILYATPATYTTAMEIAIQARSGGATLESALQAGERYAKRNSGTEVA